MVERKKPLKIPKAILKEVTEIRIVTPGETKGMFPLPIDVLRKQEFIRELFADKEFQANYDIAVITKQR